MRFVVLLALTLAGCATTSSTEMVECPKGECQAAPALQSEDEKALRVRAAFDLHCDADQLHVQPFDANSFGVEGCGKRVTYVSTCKDRRGFEAERCTWIANSP